MADLNLPFPPSGADPQPLLNKNEFIGSSGKAVKDLRGGSRFSWDLRFLRKESELWRVHSVITRIFADDVLLLRLHTDLGKSQDNATVTLRNKVLARARALPVRASAVVPPGTILGIADGFYQVNDEIAAGTSTVSLNWPLRADVNANTRLTVMNPVAKFTGLGEPPQILWRPKDVFTGERWGRVQCTVLEV